MTFNYVLSDEEFQVVINGLGELPAKISHHLLNNLAAQQQNNRAAAMQAAANPPPVTMPPAAMAQMVAVPVKPRAKPKATS